MKTFAVYKCKNSTVTYINDFANAFLALLKGEQLRKEEGVSVEILEMEYTMDRKNCRFLGEE